MKIAVFNLGKACSEGFNFVCQLDLRKESTTWFNFQT